ncbi:hypothetical protein V2J09_001222, partial [Rumex salicifolius]
IFLSFPYSIRFRVCIEFSHFTGTLKTYIQLKLASADNLNIFMLTAKSGNNNSFSFNNNGHLYYNRVPKRVGPLNLFLASFLDHKIQKAGVVVCGS